MSDGQEWKVLKGYIDAAASCEALKVGAFVLAMMTGLSIVYGCIITNTAFQIAAVEDRLKALEESK